MVAVLGRDRAPCSPAPAWPPGWPWMDEQRASLWWPLRQATISAVVSVSWIMGREGERAPLPTETQKPREL